jgi:transposase-like protein
MNKTRDIVKLRRWCIRRRGEGDSVSEICTSAQIPRRTFYNWWNRYRQHGPEGLKPRPANTPHSLQNPTRNRPEDPHAETRERLVPHTHRRIPTQSRVNRDRTHNHPPLAQGGWIKQPTPEASQTEKLQALAAEASQQPLAMRPQSCRPKMAHHKPRRPLQIRNSIPHLQGRHRRERDLATRPGHT